MLITYNICIISELGSNFGYSENHEPDGEEYQRRLDFARLIILAAHKLSLDNFQDLCLIVQFTS